MLFWLSAETALRLVGAGGAPGLSRFWGSMNADSGCYWQHAGTATHATEKLEDMPAVSVWCVDAAMPRARYRP
jgi:hypothetical protein